MPRSLREIAAEVNAKSGVAIRPPAALQSRSPAHVPSLEPWPEFSPAFKRPSASPASPPPPDSSTWISQGDPHSASSLPESHSDGVSLRAAPHVPPVLAATPSDRVSVDSASDSASAPSGFVPGRRALAIHPSRPSGLGFSGGPSDPPVVPAQAGRANTSGSGLIASLVAVALVCGGIALMRHRGPDVFGYPRAPVSDSSQAQASSRDSASKPGSANPSEASDQAPVPTPKAASRESELRARASAGDARAQYELAMAISDGTAGGEPSEAAQLLRKAAGSGVADAQYALGRRLERGEGVAPDLQGAAIWYMSAAAQGYHRAEGALGMMYARGSGAERNPALAREWLEKAAMGGDGEAALEISRMAGLGEGLPKGPEAEATWLSVASGMGVPSAKVRLDEVMASLDPEARRRASDLSASILSRARSETVGHAGGVAFDVPKASASPAPWPKNIGNDSIRAFKEAEATAKGESDPAGDAAMVEDIQRLLSKAGYEPGSANGVLGDSTVSAIRLFQQDNRLPVDGQPSKSLLDILRREASPLKAGSR